MLPTVCVFTCACVGAEHSQEAVPRAHVACTAWAGWLGCWGETGHGDPEGEEGHGEGGEWRAEVGVAERGGSDLAALQVCFGWHWSEKVVEQRDCITLSQS